jgi:hypothetical protein
MDDLVLIKILLLLVVHLHPTVMISKIILERKARDLYQRGVPFPCIMNTIHNTPLRQDVSDCPEYIKNVTPLARKIQITAAPSVTSTDFLQYNLCNIYTTVFRVKRLNNRIRSHAISYLGSWLLQGTLRVIKLQPRFKVCNIPHLGLLFHSS